MSDPRPPDTDVEIAVRDWWPSSNIAGVGYDPGTRTLEVRFKGGARYRYGDVDALVAEPLLTEKPERRLLHGESPGGYLSRQFVRRPKAHPFVKMEPVEESDG